MVKSIIAGVTTIYASAAYQIQAGVVTKYYPGGAYRVGGVLYFGFSDHLGSTSITTNASGAKIAEMRYKAWGEIRYQSGDSHTDKTYTGQRSYVDDFGLMYYNARWYDNQTGRFAQADNIEVKVKDIQSLDRFAYVLNNPILHNDPSGHSVPCSFNPAACPDKSPGVKVSGWLGWVAVIGCALQGACIATRTQGTDNWQVKTNPIIRAMSSMPFIPMAVEGGIEAAAIEGDEALMSAVSSEANLAQNLAPRPAAAGGLLVKEQIFTTTSSKGQFPPQLNLEVQSALDSISPELRSTSHGFCAEPMCISNALDAGVNPEGGSMITVKVRSPSNPAHGILLPPCSSCAELLKIFNIKWLGGQ